MTNKNRVSRNLLRSLAQPAVVDAGNISEPAPPAYKKYQTLRVTIYPRGETYSCILSFDGPEGLPDTLATEIMWSKEDVRAQTNEFLDIIEDVSSSDDVRRESALKQIAYIGGLCFRKIFTSKEMRDVFCSHVLNGDLTCVMVDTKDFTIPWGLIYLGSDPDYPDPAKFLGLNAVLIKDLSNHSRNSPHEDSRRKIDIDAKDGIRLSYAWLDTLNNVVDIEKPYISNLNTQTTDFEVSVYEVEAIEENEERLMNCRSFFADINDKEPHIVHISCHFENAETESGRQFQVRNHAFIRQAEMTFEQTRLPSSPVFIFNACEVARTDPFEAESYVDFYIRMGARCMVAPECRVGDKAAAEFMPYFYAEFLKPKTSVSEALYRARLEFWRAERNLSGLVYAIYGQAHARLIDGGQLQ